MPFSLIDPPCSSDIFLPLYSKDKLSVATGEEEVNVLGGNSSAFRVLVISLTILLGALIGAILFFELLLYLYQRFTNKNDAEAKDGR